jgi:MFS family permease
MNAPGRRWYHDLTRYHWFVLVVAALGWLFDTMDQQLFTLSRAPAMNELLAPAPGVAPAKEVLDFYGPLATSIFLLGWATGGLTFGILGDRIGRARTMLWTILIYSLCTGLSALSVGFWDFAFYRFVTGLGVGGEFAVGVALVAEVMPDRARPFALGLLQALSAVGNISAAIITMSFGQLEGSAFLESLATIGDQPVRPWRLVYVVGTLPALLALLIRRRLKEPERWQAKVGTSASAVRAGSYAEMFSHPTWRRHALLGLLLAFAGVVGLWGIGFFTPELLRTTLADELAALTKAEQGAHLAWWAGIAMILQNVGGFLGIYTFSRATHRFGRRPAFAVAFGASMAATLMVFGLLGRVAGRGDIFWMLPVMGFCQFSLFGGYAIYFPELFPTRLRSTGTSFCYNVGRFVAAIGPFTFGFLTSSVFAGRDEPIRYAGMAMCSVFLLGLAALPFMPETRGQPLPE